MSYQTIKVRFQEPVCFIQLHRPESNNTINENLIREFWKVLNICEESFSIVILEGLPEVFCFGADFQEIQKNKIDRQESEPIIELLYDLWLRMATGPFLTVSHVRGKANAGGMGFVAASDIVLADQNAQFSLSELLFGLFPACVLPFLIRKIGFQRANYLTLMTMPIPVQQAHKWGLVDAYDAKSEPLLHKHLLRLKCLSKKSILQYKQYINSLCNSPEQSKTMAVKANMELFSDPLIFAGISRYLNKGLFPWQ